MTGAGPGWQTLDYLTLALVILTGALVLVGFLALVMTAVLERPWLIPRLSDENVDAISEMLSTPMQESDGIRVLSVHPALVNAGRVPGFIIEQCYELERF